MKKSIIIIIIAVLLLAVVVVGVLHFFHYLSYPKDKTGMVNVNRVYCDEAFFQADREDFLYEPDSEVVLFFPTTHEDISYAFEVVGVKRFTTDYDEGKGYTIKFKMPNSYVSVYYRVKDSFSEIAIQFDENPSTGYLWSYEASPEGILEVVENRYQSKSRDSDELEEGRGGTRFYKFVVAKSGTVELTFQLSRGEHRIKTIIYTYECDATDGSFIQKDIQKYTE